MRQSTLLIVLLLGVSTMRPEASKPKTNPKSLIAHDADRIVVGAYGDTRTGPYGLGDNRGQNIHGAVVRNLLRAKDYDAVIFTGDAVMTNFPLWAGGYWKSFIQKTDPIVKDSKIPFFPTLGNHETYKRVPAFTVRTAAQLNFSVDGGNTPSTENVQNAVPEAYDTGEASAASPADATLPQVDPNTKEGEQQIKTWMSDLEKGSPQARVRAALNYGQFEGAVQNQFYQGPSDDRCSADADAFGEAYIKRAHYDYLESATVAVKRSYYSQVITGLDFKVKLIALDTNCLDSPAQQEFFRSELDFDGKVLVFGHHPPMKDDTTGALPWDVPPGRPWKDFRPYFSNIEGKKIVLWVFGHVHDYQRRGKTVGNDVSAPVLLIAGGGGASLDAQANPYQWQPDDWTKSFKQISAYSYLRISIKKTRAEVEVFGTDDPKCKSKVAQEHRCEFPSIDHFFVSF
jgi:hypothetical protein